MAKSKFKSTGVLAEPQKLSSVWDSVLLVLSGSARRIDSLTEINGALYLMVAYRQKDDIVRIDFKKHIPRPSKGAEKRK